MKKILILGGAAVHCKLVETAKKKGCKVVVTDYLPIECSPAKMIADESYQIDINDIPKLIELCKKERISGVLSTHLDPCQRPYGIICENMGFPCLWNRQLIEIFTNKQIFKKTCQMYGVDATEEYDDVTSVYQYPVFVKPVDSRGSRGQVRANNLLELQNAVSIAKKESKTQKYIIEKYYNSLPEIQVSYYFINGRCTIVRSADSHRGDGYLENVITSGTSPSIYNSDLLGKVNKKIENMFKSIGIKNGPVMLQGFWADDRYYLFDQGLRFPGVDYEKTFELVYGINLIEPLVEFAMTGIMPNLEIDQDASFIHGKKYMTIFPLLKSGKIERIEGLEEVRKMKEIKSLILRKNQGDIIEEVNSIDRRLAEIDVLAGSDNEIIMVENHIRSLLKVIDIYGNDMLLGW